MAVLLTSQIDIGTENVQELQAIVRKCKEKVKKLEDQMDEDPTYMDEAELEERKNAELLPQAKRELAVATLRLQVGSENDKNTPHVKQWQKELDFAMMEVELGMLAMKHVRDPEEEKRFKFLCAEVEKIKPKETGELSHSED